MLKFLFPLLFVFFISNVVSDQKIDQNVDAIENAYYLPYRQWTTQSTPVRCESDWLRSPDGTCVKIWTERKTWQSANAQCMLLMADLVTIESERMNEFVRENVDENSWIGLNDREEEGLFQWAHEEWELEGYTNWDTPSLSVSDTVNNCVYMAKLGDGVRNGKWINTDCNQRLPFVCERRTEHNRQNEPAKSEYCLESEPITNWGQWGRWEECGDKEFVYGFSVKVEPYQGSKDDTMANGISFICGNRLHKNTKNITSSVERWGSWTPAVFCSKSGRRQNYVNAVRLLVHPPVHTDDDAATLAAEIRCDDGQTKIAGTDHTYSNQRWTQWMECPQGWAVAGLKTQVEEYFGGSSRADDTALNRVGIYCRPKISRVPQSSCSE